MDDNPDNRYRYVRLVGTLGMVPLMLGVGPTVGFYAGRWLDGKLRTGPWLQYVFLVLGFGAAVRYIISVLQQVRKDIDRL